MLGYLHGFEVYGKSKKRFIVQARDDKTLLFLFLEYENIKY